MSRDVNGTYTLPLANVISNDLITTTWANTTLQDLASEMTNSLPRSGSAPMSGALRLTDGGVGAPALSFNTESTTGIYRSGANEFAVAIGGVLRFKVTASGVTIPNDGFATGWTAGTLAVNTTSTLTGAVTMGSTLAVTGAITATGGVVGNVTGNATTSTTATNNVLKAGDTMTGSLLPSADGTLNLGGSNHWAVVYAHAVQRSTAGALTINASNASGSIDFRVAGASRATINASGDLAVTNNITAPNSLAIGTPSSTGQSTLRNGGAGNTGYIEFVAANNNRQGYIGYSTGTGAGDSGSINYVGGSHAFNGTVTVGGGIEVGYRDIPRVTSLDRGKAAAVSAGQTINTGSAAGSAYSIYNDSASAITITQGSGMTLRQAGTASTGNRTLAARGFATVWFNSTTEAVISGAGVS